MNNTTGCSFTAAWILARVSSDRKRRNAGVLQPAESTFRDSEEIVGFSTERNMVGGKCVNSEVTFARASDTLDD